MLNRPATQAIQIFQIARFGALLLSSILLSKSGMDNHGIGQYETVMLMAGTFSFFWINGTTHTYLSQYRRSTSPGHANGALFWTVVLLSALLITLLLIFQPLVMQLFSFEMDTRTFYLFLAFFLCNNVSFLTDYFLLAGNNGKGLMQLSIFQLLVQTALISIPAFLYQDFTAALTGALIFTLIKSGISLIIASRNAGLIFRKTEVQQFIASASPLILSFFLGGIAIYVDGIIVNSFYDKATFATYQYGAREFPISLLLANAFSAAMVAHIGREPHDLETVRSGTLALINKLFPFAIVLMAVSYWVYPLIYNPQFQISYLYFNIYLLLIISRLTFPHSILLGLGHSRKIMIASIAEFVINIAVSLLLLQWIGIAGVAYGTVIAHISNKAILAVQLNRLGISPAQYIPVKRLVLFSSILVAIFIIFTYCIHT